MNGKKSIKNTPPISFYQGLPDSQSSSPINAGGRKWTMEDRADSIIKGEYQYV